MSVTNCLQLQILFFVLMSMIFICESKDGSCQDIGCVVGHNESRPCQCNTHCHSYNDCCSDYNHTCGTCHGIGCGTKYDLKSFLCQCNKECRFHSNCCSDYNRTCGTCHGIGCGTKYDLKSFLCQCNKECRFHSNCCSDYNRTCESCQGIGCGTTHNKSRPCQCNKKCLDEGDCCSDYNETCAQSYQGADHSLSLSSTQGNESRLYQPSVHPGSNALALVLSLAGVCTAVLAAIVVLLIYLKVRKDRSRRKCKEPEDRLYNEIGDLNAGSLDILDQVGQDNDNGERNVPDRASTTQHDRLGSVNFVRNVAYQSYDSDT
ncbi:Proteoglycan 4 [Holothuria leucospilota]|uniref:Proteoglycan 4 n=1 Tax=Holothuria leucospilota TaxID=206669 RepID=A0A9Q1BUC5_HOLLE|nr:Proteoglycan 4 [Holothuria leucospilota]